MINIAILTLALFGLAISGYIHYNKQKNKKLACLIGKDCDKVIRSDYSTLLLGVPNEVLGEIYYGFVAALALLPALGVSAIFSLPLAIILAVSGGAAAFFSVILVFIQAFVLREWCEYCLVSAGLSIVIFIFEIL